MKLLFRKRPFIVLLVVVTCILFIFFLLFFQNTLKIGLLFDLDTVQTLENKYTIYDYVKKHPVISGKKVVLITEHAHLTKVPLQEVYQKLVKKKVHLILANVLPQSAEILSKEARENKTPTFLINSAAESITNDNYFYAFYPSLYESGNYCAQRLNMLNLNKMLIIISTNKPMFLNSYAKSLLHFYRGPSKIFTLTSEQQLLKELTSFRPQTIFLLLTPAENLEILKLLHQHKSKYRVFMRQYEFDILKCLFPNVPAENLFLFGETEEPDQNQKALLNKLKSYYGIPFTSHSLNTLFVIKSIYSELKFKKFTALSPSLRRNLISFDKYFYLYQIRKKVSTNKSATPVNTEVLIDTIPILRKVHP